MPSLSPGCTLRQARLAMTAAFERAGVDSPALSARVLLAHALQAPDHVHVMEPHRQLTEAEATLAQGLARRRCQGEPVAYLTGHKEFFGFDFAVGPGCLIPRPETEMLIETLQAVFAPQAPLRFVDCGTGSGCLATTVGLLFPLARGVAVDRSRAALAWAGQNLRTHGLGHRVALVEADFAGLPVADAWADVVVANPPYVSPAEYLALDREVRDFEPAAALVPRHAPAQDDGLAALASLATETGRVLVTGGVFLCEIGWLQGERAVSQLNSLGLFTKVTVAKDLAGRDRMLFGRRC